VGVWQDGGGIGLEPLRDTPRQGELR